jgi:predicted Fe-Mo cluster-binding NifX family protein
MRICIPTGDDSGLDARLYAHFGSAPFFVLADTETGAVDVMRNAGQHHGHGHCAPIAHIDVDRTDAVVCRGIGRGAFASLQEKGLEVLITSADTVRDAITQARAGNLGKFCMDMACGGHGARHEKGAV